MDSQNAMICDLFSYVSVGFFRQIFESGFLLKNMMEFYEYSIIGIVLMNFYLSYIHILMVYNDFILSETLILANICLKIFFIY